MLLPFMLTVFLPFCNGQSLPSCNNTDCHPAASNFLSSISSPFRTLSVTSTCGEGGPTVYRLHPMLFDNTDYTCNAGEHGVNFMADRQVQTINSITFNTPVLNTYWQSKNSIKTVGGEAQRICISLNLTDIFLFRKLKAIFVAPRVISDSNLFDMRPQSLVIETYANSRWSPIRYYAKSCAQSFPGIVVKTTGADDGGTSASCREMYYSGHQATQISIGKGLQEVKFNPASQTELGDTYQSDIVVQKHYQMSAIRICMIQPAFLDPVQSYYAIADLEVDGHCYCYGHSNECSGPNGARCKCYHNTVGNNCEKCLPLYNNKPWRIGTKGKANACEDCGCNGRAVSCQYDAAKGYGVCDNCTSKSAGDKCQFCVSQYYVNPKNASQFAAGQTCQGFNGTATIAYTCADYCIPCNCSAIGSAPSSGYSCQNSTGQCTCKQFVIGRRCDTCKDEYWNINKINPTGCQACDCNPSGTINNTKLCDKTNGTCICKNNTMGQKCDQCKAGHFDFKGSNPAGCQNCDCDIGGATNSTCPPSGGQCPCRPQIAGRTCRAPNPQYYVPFLDDLVFEPEYVLNTTLFKGVDRPGHGEVNSTLTGNGFVTMTASAGTSKIEMKLKVPITLSYTLIVRYETNATASISVKLVAAAGTNLTACPNSSPALASANLPAAVARGATMVTKVCMVANAQYSVDLSLTTAPAPLLLDSFVLIPDVKSLPQYKNASSAAKTAVDSCLLQAQKVGPRPQCNVTDFSMMAALNNGAIPCVCNATGSISQTCKTHGGQCTCAPGIMRKSCDKCKVNHYGFSTTGCKPCNCHINGSVSLACNNTGDCQCKPNVTGKTCNACLPQHYGLFTGAGCMPCSCNLTYSFNNSCQDSGQCHCKPGVGGRTCNQCKDNYFGLTPNGCTACNCNSIGSLNTTCSKTTGQCQCKAKVNGTKCEKCADGHYALGTLTLDGCLPCFCSGHSTNCTSANGWYFAQTFYTWSLYSSTQAVSDQWSGTDDTGSPVDVIKGSVAGTGAQFVMQLVNEGPNLALNQYYFQARSQDFLGDKRGAYATNFSFEMALTFPVGLSPISSTINTINATAAQLAKLQYVDSTLGDVIISGGSPNFELVASIKDRPGPTRQVFTIPIVEKYWRKDDLTTGVFPTYKEMMMVLSNITDVLIRAKYSNAPGARTSLYQVKLIHASTNPISLIPVNKVEKCSCPKEYTGQFCEKCSAGYTREQPGRGQFFKCVPCKCNNHGAAGVPCHPESGACYCLNNTQGINCEQCKEGFFGNATVGLPEDCKPCMCPGNVVKKEINAFATSCTMLPDGRHQCVNCTKGHSGRLCDICQDTFYGMPKNISMNSGKCLPCSCNGRADTCNSTSGECKACRNNTGGPNCNICAPKFFGHAAINRCLPCNCSEPGATGDCDHETGRCVCKTNVVGFRCERCALNTYNTTAGCANCSCHPKGAIGQSCNVNTGQCQCRTHVIGRACDKCEDTYWDIHVTGCKACGCRIIGTANITGQTFGKCNLTTGQCSCARDAIIGRQCDTCAKGTKEKYVFIEGKYIGQYPTCNICGECFDNWGRKIDKIGIDNQKYYNRALTVWTHYSNKTAAEVIPVINGTQTDLNNIASSVNKSKAMLNELKLLETGYSQLMNKTKDRLKILNRLEASYAATNLNVTVAQGFSGYFTLDKGVSQTPALMMTTVKGLEDRYKGYEVTRKSAWGSITLATTLLSNTSNMVLSLRTKVGAARALLAGALRDETSAKIILSNDKNALQINQKVLENATKVIGSSPEHLKNIAQSLNETNNLIKTVNGSLSSAEGAVILRRDQIQAMADLAKLTKANLTLAKSNTDSALAKLVTYVQTANSTKGNATEVFQGLIKHFESLKNITQMINQGSAHIANVTATTIRPIAELKTVTTQIKGYALSKGLVDATFLRASRGQVTAMEAKANATAALDSSNRTLEQVKAVVNNLGVTRNKSSHLLNEMNAFIGTNSSITSSVNEVNAKSQNVDVQGTIIKKAKSDTETYMASLEACINEKKVRMAAAGDAVKRMATLVDNAKVIQQGSTVMLTDVTKKALDGLKLSGQNYNDLLTGQSDLAQITGRLARDVGGIKAVEELFAQIDIQRSRMKYLDSEINGLNIEMDQLLRELQNFKGLHRS